MATKPAKSSITENNMPIKAFANALVGELGLNLGKIENNTDLQAMGNSVLEYNTHYNAFLETILNKISKTIIYNRYYYSHYGVLKKGRLDVGETIEEIFIGLCDPNPYNIDRAEKEFMKRVPTDTYAAYYSINCEIFYKRTISRKEVRKAFFNFNAFEQFIRGIINSMYMSLSYDEEVLTKYLIQKNLVNGFIKNTAIDMTTPEDSVVSIQETALNLTFMKAGNNFVNVPNFAPLDEQLLFVSTAFQSQIGVKVLATAFNMEMADYLTRRVLFDNFYENDVQRLQQIYADQPDWKWFSAEEIEFLKTVQAVSCHRNFTQIYDVYLTFEFNRNGQGLYDNYFLHSSKIYALSPFEVAVAYVDQPVEVTALTLDPTEITIAKGSSAQVTADVTPNYASNKFPTFALSTSQTSVVPPSSTSSVSANGVVSIASDETETTLYLIATAGSQTATATITVS